MGDDTLDNVAEVGRSADGKPAGAEGGGNEYKMKKKIKDDELIDVPPVEEKKKSNTIHKSADRRIDDLGEKLNAFERKHKRLGRVRLASISFSFVSDGVLGVLTPPEANHPGLISLKRFSFAHPHWY